jgi:AsmA protein
MKKVLKVISIFLIIFILIVCLLVGALLVLVKPEKFKSVISTKVLEFSGRQLTLDGDISWTIFPNLGVKIGHASLQNPAGFNGGNLVEFASATASVKVMPLLHSEIEFNGVSVSGLKVHLVKNAAGQGNWEGLAKGSAVKVTVRNATVDEAKSKPVTLKIPQLDITDADVTWTNMQTKQTAAITKFAFHAQDIDFVNPFTMSGSCDFASQNPDLAGSAKWQGKVTAVPDSAQYAVKDFTFTLTTLQNKKNISLELSGDLGADVDHQTIALEKMKATLANLNLNGAMIVTNILSQPNATGHMQIPAFDLKALMQALGKDNPDLQSAKSVSADFKFSTISAANAPFLKTLALTGKIQVPDITAAKLHATDVNIVSELSGGILKFTTLTANLYQGTLVSQAQVDLNTPALPLSFNTKLTNVQAEPLLTDLQSQGSNMKIKGAGNIEVQATSSLAEGAVLNNLNGTSQFSFQNGIVDGINIGYYIDAAYAIIKGQAPPAKGDNSTSFGNLTGTAVIRNGVISNNDLTILSPRFDTKGQGTINLVSQQINFALQIQSKIPASNPTAQSLNNVSIPLTVTGDLAHPAIRLDPSALTKFIASQQIQNVKQKVQDQIKDKLPQAGNLLKNILGK